MPMWNPWHGCHKKSEGCRHCYVFREDAARGASIPTDVVHKTSSFNLPVKRDRKRNWKFPSGTHFWLCFTSDLLIEEADDWRAEIWRMIRQRPDCHFTFFTKRIDRLQVCLPPDWGDGYDNVSVGCTVENQDRADFRMPLFISIPIKHRLVTVEPMLEAVDLKKWLHPSIIEGVSAGDESGKYARPLEFNWVIALARQCAEAKVVFNFHQTGSYLIKEGRKYHIPREHQHTQAAKANIDYDPEAT